MYLLRGKIKFAKTRSGCRYSVYNLAETCHGKTRDSVPEDGICYPERMPHLTFQLIFEEKYQAEDFESGVRRIPENYRKRKLIDSLEVAADIEVELQSIQRIFADMCLVRVTADQYLKVPGDTDGSPEFDVFSKSLTSAVDINDETRLRLVEREDSHSLFRQKPERCHILSQKMYPNDKNNPNNILFMSRNLHQQFDAIDSSEGIPMFYFLYVDHHHAPIQGVVDRWPCQVYETTVNVVFKDEEAMSVLSVNFRKYTAISPTRIQLVLYFPSPLEFKHFSDVRAEETLAKWRSYDGPLS